MLFGVFVILAIIVIYSIGCLVLEIKERRNYTGNQFSVDFPSLYPFVGGMCLVIFFLVLTGLALWH